MSDISTPEPIVVRLPNWIGDACMTLPSLHVLQNSGYRLILVGKPWAQDLFKDLPNATVVPLIGSKKSQLHSLKSIVRSLPKRPKGLLFTNSFSSAYLFKKASIQSVGYRTDYRRWLLKKSLLKPQNLHEVEIFYTLTRQALQFWGHSDMTEQVPHSLNLPQSFETHQKALDVLAAANISLPFVLLAPTVVGTHQGQAKAWMHYSELARQLKQLSYVCVMCPAPGEEELLPKLVPDAICLAQQPLDVFTALLHQASLVVCNDSGTSHLAAAVGARQLTIFGVTEASRTGPWSPSAHRIGSVEGWPSLEEVLVKSLALLRGEIALESD